MKKLLLLFYFVTFSIYSQIPAGYYNTATGSGYTLKTQLYNIIKGHTDNGYAGLWVTYQISDIDKYYENDGTILDMYSENPTGVDPYNYTVTTNQCGTYAVEGDCYNREHIIPQSVFGKASPMVADAHFITATDGKVNGMRSNFPHGMVGTASYTSQNGSKLGAALNSGYSAGYTGTVFEPIDEFKGDIARMYFYFATRYENVINTWGVAYDMFNGTTDKVFTEPFLTILMTWHTNDPVSSTEIARNDAIYARQGNRNPFIDHPEYVAQIWSTTPDTQAPTAPTNLIASNITNTTVDLNWTASTDNIGVTSYQIYKDAVFLASSATNAYNVTGLTQNTTYNFTVYAKDAFGNTSPVSNTANVTTTNIVDTQAPSAIIDLVASGTTDTTTNLNWTASTDNIGVTGYDVYKDAVLLASIVTNSYNVTGLTASTSYNFTVYAKDGAGNISLVSNTAAVTTNAAPIGGGTCGSETFTNIGVAASTYATYNWTGDNAVSWTATDSRTDQLISGSRAITIRNGSLTSSTVTGGISEVTVTTQLIFGTTAGSFNVRANGVIIGSIPYSTTVQTTTLSGFNTSGNVVISITDNSITANRVAFDDLTWNCYVSTNDTQAPTTPTNLIASGTTSTSTNLTWNVSTDNVGVTSYEIYKNAVFLASSATNSYNVTGLTASTAYNFTVYAKDAAGNVSTVSNTAAVTTLAATTGANELFISEYIEGSSNNKAIEIANFTGSSVNLSVYSIKRNVNGGATWGAALSLVGTLLTNDVYVIANSSSNAAILAVTDLSSSADAMVFNGNDPIGLFKNGVLIDIVGTFNYGGVLDFAANTTLRRKSTVTSPNTTYTIAEWDTFPVDTFSDLGTHTFNTLAVQEFIPSLFNVYPNPATKNQVTISVSNNQQIDAIQFYNLMGQLIVNIKNPKIIQQRIDINHIPKGMYIIKVFNEKAYSTKRLIVN